MAVLFLLTRAGSLYRRNCFGYNETVIEETVIEVEKESLT